MLGENKIVNKWQMSSLKSIWDEEDPMHMVICMILESQSEFQVFILHCMSIC